MRVPGPLFAASVVFILLPMTTQAGGRQENSDVRVGASSIRAPRREEPPGQRSAATAPASRALGPAPHLAPISRFVPPIEPWIQSGLGWGDAALRDDGEPLCETNRVPESQCDPLGPRPFLHLGFDAQPAPDRFVRASAAGWVVAARRSFAIFTGRRSAEGAGVVVLQHDLDGNPETEEDILLTVYEHVEPLVSAGDVVQQGEVIARTSVIGGQHLHFGVRRATSNPDDPSLFYSILPPPGTTGCRPCFSQPVSLPAFPEYWDDPNELFRIFEWARLLGARGDGAAGDVMEMPGGYVAAGWTTAANIGGTGSTDMWILRLDPEGRILSQRAYGGPGEEQIVRLVPTADGGFVALALSESFGPRVPAPLLLKFNGTEERPEWQAIYIATGLYRADDLKPTFDGGYVIAGASRQRATVVKVDSEGATSQLCTQGIPGVVATSPVIIDGTYDALALRARVTDPDSTADRNDVVEVHAGMILEGSSFENPVVLLDDGSSTVVQQEQTASLPHDCFYDRINGLCACQHAIYATYSGDALPGDALYTRESILINPFLRLAIDCALATRGRMPIYFAEGTRFDVNLRATDRQGNVSAWPEPFRFTTGVDSVVCSGDACGCCLLFSTNPCVDPDPEMHWERGGCRGVEGLVSPSAPNGVCRDYLPAACGF